MGDGDWFEGSQHQSTIVHDEDAKRARRIIARKNYEKQRVMAYYFAEVQDNTNKNIIVVSHQEEVYEMGKFLLSPTRETRVHPDPKEAILHYQIDKEVKECIQERTEMLEWDVADMSKYFRQKDGSYKSQRFPRHSWERSVKKLFKTATEKERIENRLLTMFENKL